MCTHEPFGMENCQFSERAGVRCESTRFDDAMGKPPISGTARESQTLTAATPDIADTDGLATAGYVTC